MEKERKEALQAAKELTGKFIETRTVSPSNFADVFPVVYRVVLRTIAQCHDCSAADCGSAKDKND